MDLQLTETELISLITKSSASNFVQVTFGAKGVFLRDVERNKWAFDTLRVMRGLESVPLSLT